MTSTFYYYYAEILITPLCPHTHATQSGLLSLSLPLSLFFFMGKRWVLTDWREGEAGLPGPGEAVLGRTSLKYSSEQT